MAITQQDAIVDQVTRGKPTSFDEAWLPMERIDVAIDALWSAVSHLHAVADAPKLRAAYVAGEAKLVEAAVRIRQNRALYDVLAGVTESPEFVALPVADQVVVKRAMRDFRLSGVVLQPEARARYAAVSVEMLQLSTEFASAVVDATDSWSELPVPAGDHLGRDGLHGGVGGGTLPCSAPPTRYRHGVRCARRSLSGGGIDLHPWRLRPLTRYAP